MKPIIRSILISFTVLLFILSPAPCRAEVKCKTHNFNEMYNAKPDPKLVLTDSYHLGTVEEEGITYTCSGTNAKFWLYSSEIVIFLESSEAQVVTTQIKDLTQIIVTYLPATDYYPPQVEISTTGEGGWINLSPTNYTPTAKIYNMPSVGDYYIRIKRKGTTSTYIKAVEYCRLALPACPNCFIYKPE